MNIKEHVSFDPQSQEDILGSTNNFKKERSKEEFHQYLEEKQVMKTLNNVLVQFYENVDARDHPFEFMKQYFSVLGGVDINDVKKENEALLKQIEEKKSKLAELEAKLKPEEQ